MKRLLFLCCVSVAAVSCDQEPRGRPGDAAVSDSVPGARGTTALDVRTPVATNASNSNLESIRTGPGGAIPGGTRTTGPSIPGTGPGTATERTREQ